MYIQINSGKRESSQLECCENVIMWGYWLNRIFELSL
ncbi:Uncharacterised protein [Vibrio cholerae]|nr:Uncharacterised protein [Vibrio cholerae]